MIMQTVMLADTVTITEIYQFLHQLQLPATSHGFFYTAYAVLLAIQQPERLLLVTKRLYPEVARRYETTWSAVERSIRTAIGVIWERNPALLEQAAGYRLTKKPCSSQFIAILAGYLSHHTAL